MRAADGIADTEAAASREYPQVPFAQEAVRAQLDLNAQAEAGAAEQAEKARAGAHSGDAGDASDSDGGKESYSSSGECATGSQAGSGGVDKKLSGGTEHESLVGVMLPDSGPAGAAAMQQEATEPAPKNGSPHQPGAPDCEAMGAPGDAAGGPGGAADDKSKPKLPRPDGSPPCPRCGSDDTKFCYYNNYNVKQPRYFCKACQRYWTAGGMLRNVPVGAGKRKHKVGRERPQVPVLVAPQQPLVGSATPPSPQLPGPHPLAPLDPFAQIIKQLPAAPPAGPPAAPLPPQYAQSLRHLLQASPNPLLQYQALTAAAAPPPAALPPPAPAPPFNQTPFSNLNALLTQLSQASRALPVAQQEALNDPAAAVAAAVAAATAAGLPANTLLDPRLVSQLHQHASAAAAAGPASPRAPRAAPKQPRSPSATAHLTEDGGAPDGRRTRLRSLSPPAPPRTSGFAPYSTNSTPNTLPPSSATGGTHPPKFGHPTPAPALPPALPPQTSGGPLTEANAAALYEGIVKGLWNASLGHLAPNPPPPQAPPPASAPPLLGPGMSPMDTLAALAATNPNPNDWLTALLSASKQQAAQQAALTAVVQAAVAQQQQQQQQQQQAPPPPPPQLQQQQQQQPPMHPQALLPAGGSAAALQQALQAQAAALHAGLGGGGGGGGGGWQGAGPSCSGSSSSSSSFWPGMWPPNPQLPGGFPAPAPPPPQAGAVPGLLAALDAQRVLAQSLYPHDPSAAAAVAAAAAAQQHPGAPNPAAAALAANALLAATQHQHQHHAPQPPPPPQQPMQPPPPLHQAPNHWLAAAAAAAAAGGGSQPPPPGPPWSMSAPHPSLSTPPGWVPTDGGGSSGHNPFSSWPGSSGGLTQAQAAAVMAMAAGHPIDPALQAQVTGMLSHSLGATVGSAFRAVGHGGMAGAMMGTNGNISALSNGSGTSTATALMQQSKHAQSYDSAQ